MGFLAAIVRDSRPRPWLRGAGGGAGAPAPQVAAEAAAPDLPSAVEQGAPAGPVGVLAVPRRPVTGAAPLLPPARMPVPALWHREDEPSLSGASPAAAQVAEPARVPRMGPPTPVPETAAAAHSTEAAFTMPVPAPETVARVAEAAPPAAAPERGAPPQPVDLLASPAAGSVPSEGLFEGLPAPEPAQEERLRETLPRGPSPRPHASEPTVSRDLSPLPAPSALPAILANAAPGPPSAFPPPRRSEAAPAVRIDTVEVVVTAPPEPRPAPRAAAPGPDVTSRLYLRRL